MHPKEKIQEDLKIAMKAGDTQRRDTLRLLTSAFKQIEVDGGSPITEEQAYTALGSEAKKRRDTIAETLKAGRTDIAAKEQAELELIEAYLPKQLSREEVEAEVRKAIEETDAKSAKDTGSLMKVLMPRVKGRADGKLVNDVVKTLLNG